MIHCLLNRYASVALYLSPFLRVRRRRFSPAAVFGGGISLLREDERILSEYVLAPRKLGLSG